MAKHNEEEGDAHFLTFGCYHHFHLFKDQYLCKELVKHLFELRDAKQFYIFAFVVMPNHVHLLLKPDEVTSISKILFRIKYGSSVKALKYLRDNYPEKAEKLHVIKSGKSSYQFWQSGGGYDRNVSNDTEIRNNVEYIHNNPVRKGLVRYPEEYPWSSARFWLNDQSGGEMDDPFS